MVDDCWLVFYEFSYVLFCLWLVGVVVLKMMVGYVWVVLDFDQLQFEDVWIMQVSDDIDGMDQYGCEQYLN